MEITEFIGVWENASGNILEIRANDKKSLKVNFISCKTGKPVIREFFGNKESIDMYAELDYYGSSLEVELWEKGKGFQLNLLYNFNENSEETGNFLTPGLATYSDDNLIWEYEYLFMPLENYKRIK